MTWPEIIDEAMKLALRAILCCKGRFHRHSKLCPNDQLSSAFTADVLLLGLCKQDSAVFMPIMTGLASIP